MELATKAMAAAASNTAINVLLIGSFAGLSVRSLNQQREIEALEAQKDSLLKSNKSIKQTLWNWKQQLFAEAADSSTPLVPLSKLKSIYGEASTIPSAPLNTVENNISKQICVYLKILRKEREMQQHQKSLSNLFSWFRGSTSLWRKVQ